jgi:hypothetical protein
MASGYFEDRLDDKPRVVALFPEVRSKHCKLYQPPLVMTRLPR